MVQYPSKTQLKQIIIIIITNIISIIVCTVNTVTNIISDIIITIIIVGGIITLEVAIYYYIIIGIKFVKLKLFSNDLLGEQMPTFYNPYISYLPELQR